MPREDQRKLTAEDAAKTGDTNPQSRPKAGKSSLRSIQQKPTECSHSVHSQTQSAMKIFVSPCFALSRFDANTNLLPSCDHIGNPSKVGLVVTRSSCVPSRRV